MDTNNIRYNCVQCVAAYSAAGFCPNHPDEPLLDTHDETVREYLATLDAKRLRKKLAFGLLAMGTPLLVTVFVIPQGYVGFVLTPLTLALVIFRRFLIARHQYIFTPWTLDQGPQADVELVKTMDRLRNI